MVIIGARPSMGKTSAGMQFCFEVAELFQQHGDGEVVYIASAEMRANRLLMREVARRTGIDTYAMKRGELDDAQMEQIDAVIQHLDTLPIIIDDEYGLATSEVRSRVAAIEEVQGLRVGLLLYDYLQLAGDKAFNDFARTGIAAKTLKKIAHDANIPVIALSQLNRNLESREEKSPTLADMKNSGDIEDITDVVLLLHRPDYHAMKKEGREAEIAAAHIIVAKNRDGQTGLIRVDFDPVCTSFQSTYEPV